jgi:protein SCO1/2
MHSARVLRLWLLVLFALIALSLGSCVRKPERRYDLSGKIVAVDRNAHQLTIQHQDIAGLMPGMTMPFNVNDDWVFDAAQPGDNITATLVIAGDSSHLENVVVTKSSGPPPSEASVRIPQIGDRVPDFTFVNQDGKRLRLSQFKGKAVLLTFIYTRCPLPDYCIRMSNNFGAVAKELKQQPALYDKFEQLSISFDPKYDTPKILQAYGSNYAGEVDPKFTHWQFVTSTPAEIKKITDFFGLTYMPDGGQIVHSLRTAVIAPNGTVADVYNGNDWKPNDAVEAVKSVLK